MVYLFFLHGRNNPTDEMTQKIWDNVGPFVGPVDFTSTYGKPIIHNGKGEFIELKSVEGCTLINGRYYSDYEVIDEDTFLAMHAKKEQVLSYDNIKKEYEGRPVNPVQALKSLLQGVWDDPDLMKCGPIPIPMKELEDQLRQEIANKKLNPF